MSVRMLGRACALFFYNNEVEVDNSVVNNYLDICLGVCTNHKVYTQPVPDDTGAI